MSNGLFRFERGAVERKMWRAHEAEPSIKPSNLLGARKQKFQENISRPAVSTGRNDESFV